MHIRWLALIVSTLLFLISLQGVSYWWSPMRSPGNLIVSLLSSLVQLLSWVVVGWMIIRAWRTSPSWLDWYTLLPTLFLVVGNLAFSSSPVVGSPVLIIAVLFASVGLAASHRSQVP